MGEDVETPKGDGDVDSSTKFPVPDHAENMADALARAKEAVGEKGGLRGALAARMDTMSRTLDKHARTSFVVKGGIFHPIEIQAITLDEMVLKPSARLVSKATGLLRDRLRPVVHSSSSNKGK